VNNHLVFAASWKDAEDAMTKLGLAFDETVWVMNAQLLGAGDFTGHTVHYTALFREMPAFAEAVAIYGEEA
jgi:hypothetical protein